MRMNGIRWHGFEEGRIIDVTPLPWWRRVWRSIGSVLFPIAALAVFVLIASVLTLLILGTAGAILVSGYVRAWRSGGTNGRMRDGSPG